MRAPSSWGWVVTGILLVMVAFMGGAIFVLTRPVPAGAPAPTSSFVPFNSPQIQRPTIVEAAPVPTTLSVTPREFSVWVGQSMRLWPTNSDILLRRWFYVPGTAADLASSSSGIEVGITATNQLELWVNGNPIAPPIPSEGCASRNQRLIIYPNAHVGLNLLAVRGWGRSDENYLDVQVTRGP